MNGEWNKLIGHPKDRGKDNLNSRSNSLQLEENDVDGMPTNIRPFDR
jgi:hypothetical protein